MKKCRNQYYEYLETRTDGFERRDKIAWEQGGSTCDDDGMNVLDSRKTPD